MSLQRKDFFRENTRIVSFTYSSPMRYVDRGLFHVRQHESAFSYVASSKSDSAGPMVKGDTPIVRIVYSHLCGDDRLATLLVIAFDQLCVFLRKKKEYKSRFLSLIRAIAFSRLFASALRKHFATPRRIHRFDRFPSLYKL